MTDDLSMDSATALERVAAGDAAAWSWLAETQRPRLLASAMRLLRCPALAEDAVQEALVLVRSQAGGFHRRGGDPEREASAWLGRLVRCRTFNLLREGRRRRRREHDAADDDIAHADQPDRLDEEQVRLLHAALAELSPGDRRVIALMFFDELPYERVADELGCSVATARVRSHRAVQRIRRRLERRGHRVGLVALLAVLLGDDADAAERGAMRARLAAAPRSRRPRLIAAALALATLVTGSVLALAGPGMADGDAVDAAEPAAAIAMSGPTDPTRVAIDDPDLEAWLDLGRRRGYLFSRGRWWAITAQEFSALPERAAIAAVVGPGNEGGYGMSVTPEGGRIDLEPEGFGVIALQGVRRRAVATPTYAVDPSASERCRDMVGLVIAFDDACHIASPAELQRGHRIGDIFEAVDPLSGRRTALLELVDVDDEGGLECRVIDGDLHEMATGDLARPTRGAVEPPRGEG
ncbi:MAG TPA: RNA polymerase sigma factor [Planctomycetota bacterium]|nr:RNA polymerase sigma factor [Planctomycetota bacterium]